MLLEVLTSSKLSVGNLLSFVWFHRIKSHQSRTTITQSCRKLIYQYQSTLDIKRQGYNLFRRKFSLCFSFHSLSMYEYIVQHFHSSASLCMQAHYIREHVFCSFTSCCACCARSFVCDVSLLGFECVLTKSLVLMVSIRI